MTAELPAPTHLPNGEPFPPWCPPAWRRAYDPIYACFWPPPPDPTLPIYYAPGIAARKFHRIAAIGSPSGWMGAAALPYLKLAAIELVPMKGWKRYVTPCPNCARPATALIARRPRDPPFCLVCRPRYLPKLTSLLAALNACAQLDVSSPAGVIRAALTQLRAAVTADTPALLPLLHSLSSPAVDSLSYRPPYRHPIIRFTKAGTALGWKRTRRAQSSSGSGPVRKAQFTVAGSGLHPVQCFVGAAERYRS